MECIMETTKKNWLDMFKLAKMVNETVKINIKKSGLKFTMVDSAHVEMVECNVNANAFNKFEMGNKVNNINITFDIDDMLKYINQQFISNDTFINIKIDKIKGDNDIHFIEIKMKNEKINFYRKYKSSNAYLPNPKFPKIKFDSMFYIKDLKDFKSIVNSISKISDIISIRKTKILRVSPFFDSTCINEDNTYFDVSFFEFAISDIKSYKDEENKTHFPTDNLKDAINMLYGIYGNDINLIMNLKTDYPTIIQNKKVKDVFLNVKYALAPRIECE